MTGGIVWDDYFGNTREIISSGRMWVPMLEEHLRSGGQLSIVVPLSETVQHYLLQTTGIHGLKMSGEIALVSFDVTIINNV